MRLGKVRLQFQCPAVAGDRFVQLSLVLQGVAQVVVGLGIVRLQFQCPAAAGDRFVQLPCSLSATPRLLWASAKSGFQFQCPAVAGDRFVQFPLVPSTHRPGCCVPRHSPASVPVPGGSRRSLRPASPGPSSSAQVVVCLGIVRLQFQCPAVAGDCLIQLSLLLQHKPQVVVRRSIVRIQFQCPAVALDCFRKIAQAR